MSTRQKNSLLATIVVGLIGAAWAIHLAGCSAQHEASEADVGRVSGPQEPASYENADREGVAVSNAETPSGSAPVADNGTKTTDSIVMVDGHEVSRMPLGGKPYNRTTGDMITKLPEPAGKPKPVTLGWGDEGRPGQERLQSLGYVGGSIGEGRGKARIFSTGMGRLATDHGDRSSGELAQALATVSADEIWVIAKSKSRPAPVDEDSPGCGAMLAELPGEDKKIPLPLKHTDVQGGIIGYIATVEVTQQFHNPFDTKIEAVYVFPLPQDAAVNEFIMTIGDRRIRGIIREREEAEKIYREARRQGHVASLLTQERPNIFT